MEEAFDLIYKSWGHVNATAFSSHALGDPIDSKINAHRVISNCGHFILLFAQLEKSIDEAYDEVVGTRGNFPFMARAGQFEGLLLREEIDKISDDYEIRCDIAHGRVLTSVSIDIPGVVDRYKPIIEKLCA